MVAVRRNAPAPLFGQTLCLFVAVDRADRFARRLEGRILRIHFDLGQQGGEGHLEWQHIAQLLLDDVADHALGFGPQDVQRIAGYVLVGGPLQGQ